MTATSEDQQRAATQAVLAAAAAEVTRGLLTVELDDAAAIADWIVEFLPAVAEEYGLALAALAADWYDTLRAEAGVPGSFEPVLPPLPDPERWESMARWVTAGDKTEVETLIQGGVQRTLVNMHREAVMLSSEADPEAAGWARFAQGETCGFCLMLTTRGGVYTSASAKFGAHDHCDCMAGPIWKGKRGASQVAAYKASAKRRNDETREADNERARQWMRDNDLL